MEILHVNSLALDRYFAGLSFKHFVTVAVVHVDTTSPRNNQIIIELQKYLKGVRLSCFLANRYKHNAIEH